MIIDSWDKMPKHFGLNDLDKVEIIEDQHPQKRVAVRLGLICSFFMRQPLAIETRFALAKCGDQYQLIIDL